MPIDVAPVAPTKKPDTSPPPTKKPDDSGAGIVVIEAEIVVMEEIPAAEPPMTDQPKTPAAEDPDTVAQSEAEITTMLKKVTIAMNVKPEQSGFVRSQTVFLCLILIFLLSF